MPLTDFQYSIEQCDIPEERHACLAEYRAFRRKCLEYLIGDIDTSVMNQVHDLAWHTAVYRTLNEARRLEPERTVNGALWELCSAGYASLMSLGIRRLVDRDPRTDSLWNVIAEIERRPELMTREHYVCYDGIPYDYEAARQKQAEPLNWETSEKMHQAFDRLADSQGQRKRTDTVQGAVLTALKERLSHPTIEQVCTMANHRVAHAERLSANTGPFPIATYNDIDEAFRQIVKVANYLSSVLFFDVSLGSVVPVPQFDLLESLDAAWVTTENLPRLHAYWHQLSSSMSDWADISQDEFLPTEQS